MQGEGASGTVVVVEGLLVEVGVLLVRHVGLLAAPDGGHRVDGLELGIVLPLGLVVVGLGVGRRLLAAVRDLHLDGIAHVVGVLGDELAELPLAQVLVVVLLPRVVAQGEDHVGAPGAVVEQRTGVARRHGVAGHAVGLPDVGLVGAEGAADHTNLLGDHESRIEAHAELADNLGCGLGAVRLVVARERCLELLAARVGNGAQVTVKLLGGHADARVGDRDCARVLVEAHTDGKLGLERTHACSPFLSMSRFRHNIGISTHSAGLHSRDEKI